MIGSQKRVQLMCNPTQNYVIWEFIALFLTNQIAGNVVDFKMNVIRDLYNRQKLALDFFKKESCLQDRDLSLISRGQVSVLNKSRT